jgi:DnaJ-class molecular chaperone
MSDGKNHYELLGVSLNAPVETIHRAWKRVVRVSHPDHADGETDAIERTLLTVRLNEAYATLIDPVRRRGYEYEIGARSVPCERCGQPGGVLEGDQILALCRACYHGRVMPESG